jgi:mitochondrial fission protein ELM1
LLLDDGRAPALEAATLDPTKAACNSVLAILSPVWKRIEKKLSLSRSGNSRISAATPSKGSTWIVTDGSVGMEAQGIAVAEAVGLPYTLKRVRVTGATRLIPARLQIYLPPARLLRAVSANEPLTAPWPRLVISIGRRSVPIALAIKRTAKAFGLHIQNPKVPPGRFDLIAAPVHDGFTGSNVINTFGAVHSVTPDRLKDGAKTFAAVIDPLPHPRIAVLLGGESQAFTFPPEDAGAFGASLAALARDRSGSLLVTPSRRTLPGSVQALSAAIAGVPQFIWDGSGPNPYHAFLALADAIVVTEDSVNMVTEAAGTGKPVYVQRLKGNSRRLGRFHELMQERGATRPFQGKLETWSYAPINDTELVASAIRKALLLEPTP